MNLIMTQLAARDPESFPIPRDARVKKTIALLLAFAILRFELAIRRVCPVSVDTVEPLVIKRPLCVSIFQQ